MYVRKKQVDEGIKQIYTYLWNPIRKSCSVFRNNGHICYKKVGEKVQCCLSCASFHILSLPGTRPVMTMKEKKLARVRSQITEKICVGLSSAALQKRSVRKKERSCTNTLVPIVSLTWRWVCFILLLLLGRVSLWRVLCAFSGQHYYLAYSLGCVMN